MADGSNEAIEIGHLVTCQKDGCGGDGGREADQLPPLPHLAPSGSPAPQSLEPSSSVPRARSALSDFPVPSSVRIGSELLLGGPLAQTHCKAHFSMRVESSTFLLGLPTFRVACKLLHGLRGCDNGLWMDKIV